MSKVPLYDDGALWGWLREVSAESQLTNPPGHLWRDKWTALSGPLSGLEKRNAVAHARQPRPDSGLGVRAKVIKTFQVDRGGWTRLR